MSKTNLTYALTFLSGLLLGWLALGWWLWPVAYVGEANTYELNQADKLRYAEACVTSYAATGLTDPSWFSGWYADEIQQTLEQVAQHRPDKGNQARMLESLALQSMGVYAQTPTGFTAQIKTQDQVSVAKSDLLPIIGIITIALLVTGVGFWLIWRRKDSVSVIEQVHEQFDQDTFQRFAARNSTDYIPVKPTPTRTLARASLTFGPDQPTDQHFPIDSQQEGEPSPGEFGVNQVGDQPAWDVWLFDKQALVTVTKVLADQKSDELASRGEVIGWDGPFLLETPNLKMTGKASMVEAGLRVELTVEAKDEN